MTQPHSPDPESSGPHTDVDADSTPGNPLLEFVRTHPIGSILLVAAILGGAIAGYIVFDGVLSAPRSILGGALAGWGCWLLVMVGRVIGD